MGSQLMNSILYMANYLNETNNPNNVNFFFVFRWIHWLYKTDSQGNVQLVELYGGPNDDIGYSVRQASDGGYIVAGYTESFGNGSSDIWLIKTDSDCIEEWSQSFGGSNDDYGESVRLTNDGGYVVAGWTNSYGNGNYDAWIIKTDPEGNSGWNGE